MRLRVCWAGAVLPGDYVDVRRRFDVAEVEVVAGDGDDHRRRRGSGGVGLREGDLEAGSGLAATQRHLPGLIAPRALQMARPRRRML